MKESDFGDFRTIHLLPLLSNLTSSGLDGTGEVVAEVLWGRGLEPYGRKAPRKDYLNWVSEQHGPRSTKLVLDISGVNQGDADFGGLKRTLRRGGPFWLEPGVEDIDDVFDALTLDPEQALIGSLRVEGLGLFEEAIEVSDSCIPMIYLDGREAVFQGRRRDASDTLEAMLSMGYEECVLMDLRSLGRALDRDLWTSEFLECLKVIPAGGISMTDIPFLTRSGYDMAVMDPVVRSDESPDDEVRPLGTEHTVSSPRHSGWWSGA